jgi:hypothetical protein
VYKHAANIMKKKANQDNTQYRTGTALKGRKVARKPGTSASTMKNREISSMAHPTLDR